MLALGLSVLLIPTALGQSGSTDRIRYRNAKKDYQEEVVLGTTQETSAGLVVTLNNKSTVKIPAPDIVSIEYGSLPGLDSVKLELSSAENQGNAVKARDLYAAEVKKNPTDPRTKKFLDYREVIWSARVVDAKIGKEFADEAPAVITKLVNFSQEYSKKNAWEVWHASQIAARMNAELAQYSDAATVYSSLSKVANLTPELKYEARIGEIEMLIRSGNVLTSAPLVAEVSKATDLPKSGPIVEKLAVVKAVVDALSEKKAKQKPTAQVKIIEDVIAKTPDPSVRAFGHNMLGELYLQCELPRDAMWELLRVEVVENLDRDEVIKAVWRLADCFKLLGQENRAEAYREKLPTLKWS